MLQSHMVHLSIQVHLVLPSFPPVEQVERCLQLTRPGHPGPGVSSPVDYLAYQGCSWQLWNFFSFENYFVEASVWIMYESPETNKLGESLWNISAKRNSPREEIIYSQGQRTCPHWQSFSLHLIMSSLQKFCCFCRCGISIHSVHSTWSIF